MDHESLARCVPRAVPGAIVALSLSAKLTLEPKEGLTARFGRNRPEVDVCVGETDLRVSRTHGTLTHRDGHWWVRNIGRLPIRLPRTRLLFRDEDPVPLPEGYTPLFIRGSRDREHLLEMYVVGWNGGQPAAQYDAMTRPPKRWSLTADEHLALVVLGQRYLLHEANPQPISRQHAAEVLSELQPNATWSAKRVEHVVADVRARLSARGVYGLVREEVGEPVGNALNDNLLRELVMSTTLVPTDLALLDPS
ncbi:FHA domain-containing protein [Kibdelosporangium persicum]|uniref:Translation initiation factor IF-2 n=1 Tax=Kibdelosporangium persicum TaxID=2698649 RepID=A0ABX2FKS0_9PSEU|nr:FHA domain-containing protein [Kibdelosporangium persicum]NRN71368.1 Translation initiation factor IF-2 [Kibdelosporangium persicum]